MTGQSSTTVGQILKKMTTAAVPMATCKNHDTNNGFLNDVLALFTLSVRMRFKRKRDDVKALHATLKDLQGIDPLDYLARYN